MISDILFEFTHFYFSAVRGVANFLNWRFIRTFGQLQILTKASYVMLILVPLLAATWPAVRLVVNQHYSAVTKANSVYRNTFLGVENIIEIINRSRGSEEIENLSDTNTVQKKILYDAIEQLQLSAKDFSQSVEQYTDNYAQRSIENLRFPWTFAAAFFAALTVVFGHLVYQLLAPETVRAMTWDEFVTSRKEDYSKHKSIDALERARSFSHTGAGRRLEREHKREAEHLLHHMESLMESTIERQTENKSKDSNLEDKKISKKLQIELNNTIMNVGKLTLLEARDLLSSSEFSMNPDFRSTVITTINDVGNFESDDSLFDMSTIERGARAEYLSLASKNFFGVILTGALYSLGMEILLTIVWVQSKSVMAASKWDSFKDLFAPI